MCFAEVLCMQSDVKPVNSCHLDSLVLWTAARGVGEGAREGEVRRERERLRDSK